MLSIKNCNGRVMYRFHEAPCTTRSAERPPDSPILVPYMVGKRTRLAHLQDEVDFIIEMYLKAASMFRSENYNVYFDVDGLAEDIEGWVVASS